MPIEVDYPSKPSDAEIRVSAGLQELACDVEDALIQLSGEKFGFMLFCFPLNQPQGNGSYISNADAGDALPVIQATIDRIKKRLPTPALHKFRGLS